MHRFVSVLLLLALTLGACSETPREGADSSDEEMVLLDSSATTLTNLHPLLDAAVRPGDSMLVDLYALMQEGAILEGDMEMIGYHVRSLGGMDDPDGLITKKSYRVLIQEALFSDLSEGSQPCEGCSDSLLIRFPGNNAVIFLGMGQASLDEMMAEALSTNSTLPEFRKPPYDPRIDSLGWTGMMEQIYADRDDTYDPILFGNVVIYLASTGEMITDYTYGQILSVVVRVKENDQFDHLRVALEKLAADDPVDS